MGTGLWLSKDFDNEVLGKVVRTHQSLGCTLAVLSGFITISLFRLLSAMYMRSWLTTGHIKDSQAIL